MAHPLTSIAAQKMWVHFTVTFFFKTFTETYEVQRRYRNCV